MTAVRHDHNASSHAAHGHEPTTPAAASAASAVALRRRWPWLLPAGVGGVVVLGLVASGVIPFGLVLYALPLAGCGLMHMFMGHGGHGAHGAHEQQESAPEVPSRATGDAPGGNATGRD